jgi:hypothetical protein
MQSDNSPHTDNIAAMDHTSTKSSGRLERGRSRNRVIRNTVQQREFSTLSEFKIWVRHECEHDDAPYTFPITVEAPTPAAAMEQAKGTLAHAYMMSHAQGVADCPAMMTWWLDGHEAEADRALMVAQRVGA